MAREAIQRRTLAPEEMGRRVAGIFVGGRGSRMGGKAKGLLQIDGQTLVEKLRQLAEPLAEVFLVGDAGPYADLGLPSLADRPAGIGPLGGLIALLERTGEGTALALACDMPWVSRRLLDSLLDAPPAAVVAPRREGRWEPLCARYDASLILETARQNAAEGRTSLQALLDAAGARPLPESDYDPAELTDWDTPSDVASGRIFTGR
jgi:molybdopterin-guanine dinucleotide biosynthesis protein A